MYGFERFLIRENLELARHQVHEFSQQLCSYVHFQTFGIFKRYKKICKTGRKILHKIINISLKALSGVIGFVKNVKALLCYRCYLFSKLLKYSLIG